MAEKGMKTRADCEAEMVRAMYADALKDSTIHYALSLIDMGQLPADAWRAAAVSLAIENESLRKQLLRYIELSPASTIFVPTEGGE